MYKMLVVVFEGKENCMKLDKRDEPQKTVHASDGNGMSLLKAIL